MVTDHDKNFVPCPMRFGCPAQGCSAGNGQSPGRQMRPKIILDALIWSEIRVFVARRIMFGPPTLNLCMHSNNGVMSVQTG